MRVGIITFHRALNYGALLQAFALRHAFTGLGAEAQIVDYRNPTMEAMYFYPSFSQRKNPKDKAKFLIQGKSELKRREKFENYRKKYLNLSDAPLDEKELTHLTETFDKLVVGSDQVWNYGAHDFDKNFFFTVCQGPKQKILLCRKLRHIGFAGCSVGGLQGLAGRFYDVFCQRKAGVRPLKQAWGRASEN